MDSHNLLMIGDLPLFSLFKNYLTCSFTLLFLPDHTGDRPSLARLICTHGQNGAATTFHIQYIESGSFRCGLMDGILLQK